MAWSDLDYEVQLKVLDRITYLANSEDEFRVANGLTAAANELKMWCNNYEYAVEDKEILQNFVEAKSTIPETVTRLTNRATMIGISGILATVGCVLGGSLSDHQSVELTLVSCIIGATLFGVLGLFIAKVKNDKHY